MDIKDLQDSNQNGAKADRGPLERFLSLFTPVGRHEGGTVLLMTLNIFLLMSAYYIIKPVREALILASWGAEAKIYASAGQALLLLAVVPFYSWLANQLPRRRLITTVLVFFAVCLVGFYLLARTQVDLGIPFYLWVGIFNVMVVAQFWSFANDIYTEDEGKRLFPLLGFGMSAGAVFGSFITGKLIEPLGTFQLMLLSALLLLASLLLTVAADRRKGSQATPVDDIPGVQQDSGALSGEGGFSLVMKSRYLLLIAGMMIVANLVNTTGEYVLGARVKADVEAAIAPVEQVVGEDVTDNDDLDARQRAREDQVGRAIGRFYADFFSVVNLVGLLAQLFLVSRLVRWLGVGRAIMVLPLVALGGYAMIAVFPILAVARWIKTAENATDYSLQNTSRNMLFLPTSRDEKYKAKQVIDTFCVRIGDVSAALLVLVGTMVLHLTPGRFALINVALAAAWLVLTVFIRRKHASLSSD